jgi:hypothetical protein
MKQAAAHVPASVRSDPAARATYEAAVLQAWDAYHALRERLADANFRTMAAIGKIKGQSEKEIRKEAEKKSQEMARYVIPIAAGTQLYHTVSGIVLLRYIRMCEAANTPREARRIVEQMVEEVRRVDPAFVAEIQETPRPRADTIEAQLSEPAAGPVPDLDGPAQLINATPDAPRLVAAAVREVTGSTLPDKELLRRVLDPALNAAWGDTLNTWDHSPVLRALRHVHYTFRKRLSLSAYAQDQRHRMTPGTRPLLSQCLRAEPDVHVPDIVAEDPGALAIYDAAIKGLWDAMLRLRDVHGIPADDATYLLQRADGDFRGEPRRAAPGAGHPPRADRVPRPALHLRRAAPAGRAAGLGRGLLPRGPALVRHQGLEDVRCGEGDSEAALLNAMWGRQAPRRAG